MEKCLVCGNEKVSCEKVCKMCGMKFAEGISYSGLEFCSEACKNFFIEISNKSPYLTKREIVI